MKLHLGETVFGIHNVSGAAGSTYHLTIRDFDPLNGYCSCPDFRTNKLSFCKHLLFAAKQIQEKRTLRQRMRPKNYPFGEIYCDPMQDYQITHFNVTTRPDRLAQVWEFSMNHCYFDKNKKNKITGYYNLQALKEKISGVLLRREKQEVLQQLPPIQEMTVPIQLTPEQAEIHAGLNLQCADTVINFELPWNPAKKNQRIGRVHRLGQKSDHITVINLVAQNSIEARIAEGIVLKSSLFDAVLNEKNQNDEVDFSRRGRATFIQELQELISGLEIQTVAESVETETTMDDSREETRVESEAEEKLPVEPASTVDHAVLQQTLDQGLQFLNGILKMATGHSLLTEQQTIAIDADTGEVTIKFKLPKINK